MSDLKIIKIIDKLRVNFKKLLVFDSTTFKDHSQLLNLLENPEILTKPNPSAFNSLKQSNSEENLTNQKIVFLPSKTKSPEAKFSTNNERVNEDYRSLNEKYKELLEKNQNLKFNNEILIDRITNFEYGMKEKILLIKDLESETDTLKEKISYQSDLVEDYKVMLEELKDSYNSLFSTMNFNEKENEEKIENYAEKLKEANKKESELNEKIRVLLSQLEKIRLEYDQVSEDFNISTKLLNEQINIREKQMQEEDQKTKNLDKKISDLEKKYKSLEKLYVQSLQINSDMQEKIFSLTQEKTEIENKLKEFENKQNIEHFILENETDHELFHTKEQQKGVDNEIIEISDQLGTYDYELTKSLQLNESLLSPSYEVKELFKENISDLSRIIIENKLIGYESFNEFELVKNSIQALNDIKQFMIQENIIPDNSFDVLKSLQTYVHKEKSDQKSVESKPKIQDYQEFYENYSEPSPRIEAKFFTSNNYFSEIQQKDEKLLSKKKQINLHKQQIVCLKKQLRDAENALKANENFNLEVIKRLIRQIFQFLPKLDDKLEEEIEMTMKIIGFTSDDCKDLKNIRMKKGKFRLFY